MLAAVLLGITASGLAVADRGGHSGGGGYSGGGHSGGGHWSGRPGGGWSGHPGGGHFNGHSGGFWGGHRHHFFGPRLGIFLGAPLFGLGYYSAFGPDYYPAPYYYPPVVTAPPVYIEQADEEAAPEQLPYWYYCAESKTYYPYVKRCAGEWQRVPAQPAPGQ